MQLTLEQFSTEASPAQARVFAAACAERAAGILLWSVAQADRPDDVARYVDALELLWRPRAGEPAEYLAERDRLESMHEMTVGDELRRPLSIALRSVVVLHSGLGVAARPEPATLADCSMAARNGAFRLENLFAGRHLLSDEERSQDHDINALIQGVPAEAVRDGAREVSRERLSLFRTKY